MERADAALTDTTKPLQGTPKGKGGKKGGGAGDSGLAAFMELVPALLMLMLQAFFGSSAAPRKPGEAPSPPVSLTDTLRLAIALAQLPSQNKVGWHAELNGEPQALVAQLFAVTEEVVRAHTRS